MKPLKTTFTNVNEEGEPYDSHDNLDAAMVVLRRFPNDTIVVSLVSELESHNGHEANGTNYTPKSALVPRIIASLGLQQVVALHPDGTTCPEYSRPFRSACPLIGTGIHKSMRPWNTFMYAEDILTNVVGPIDIAHLLETGTFRRIAKADEL